MLSAGCVFVNLRDPSDGQSLALTERSGGIWTTLPSRARMPRRQPSHWFYNTKTGEWEQTEQTLSLNGTELPPIADEFVPVEEPEPPSEALVEKQAEEENDLQAKRQKLDEQRAARGEEKICSCGFECKRRLLPRLRRSGSSPAPMWEQTAPCSRNSRT